ncbi:MAG TPA: peptidoglycan DD-metalloendopeptidase family protein [Gemmatirosa sp.]|nr:peptidoglycan DD-metalloendopeptidase family protein [Gemmatirosa sp.]
MELTRATRGLAGALAAAALATAAPLAACHAQSALPPTVAAREAELARTKAERALLETQLRSLRATVGDIRDEARNFERQADATARIVTALDRQLAEIGDDAAAATARLARAERRLGAEQVGLRRRLVQIYKRGPLYEYEALLSARSFGDLVARYKYLHEVTVRDRAKVSRVQALRDTVASQRDLIVRLQADLVRNRVEQGAEVQRLRALEGDRARALARLQETTRRAEARLALVARDERRLTSLIAAAETARRRAEARGTARAAAPALASGTVGTAGTTAPGASGTPATTAAAARGPSTASMGRLDWPVGGTLLYRFGRAAGANRTVTRWNGIGIAAAEGTPVHAVAPGDVVVAEQIGTYGLTVIVQHGAGDYSVYGSLARADVRRGAAVTKGQVVGTVGAADPDLPAHLHFEVRPGGRAVDPLTWLRERQ